MYAECRKGVSPVWTKVLSWKLQGMLKGEDQLTKRQYLHATTTTATTTTGSVASITKPVDIEVKI